ncbi:MAG: hypothetical protein ACXW32_02475 [Limisphaerales bacterium]
MHQRFIWSEAQKVPAITPPQRRGHEAAIKLVAFQSEIFRPVITRSESRIWNPRRQRSRIITATV